MPILKTAQVSRTISDNSSMDKEVLYKIFSRHLDECHNLCERAQDLIRRVAQIYTIHLTKISNIPLQVLDDVIEEIEHEVVEMYRKKTYGFLTLEDYRRHKYSQKDDQ